MEPIGLLGIGIMGTAYAHNLLSAGFQVIGWDIDPQRRMELQEAGGRTVGSAAELASQTDVILSALPSSAALIESVEGPNGLADGSHPGLVLIEMSTLPLEIKYRARDLMSDRGVAVVDAPVSGTGLQAAAAEIVIYASGDSTVLGTVRPVFDAISKSTFELGDYGNGSKMKYVANLLVSVHNLATAEAFVLGMRGGLEADQILEVISAGVGSSRILEIRGPMMVADDYPPAAKLKMFLKDIDVIGDFARSLGTPTPLLDTSLAFYQQAVAEGLGELDAVALCRLLETKTGHVR